MVDGRTSILQIPEEIIMSTTYAAGKYVAEVLDQGFDISRVKKTSFFFLQLRILGRYGDQGQILECQKYERIYRQYLNTDTGVNILRDDLRVIGIELKAFAQLHGGTTDPINLVGRRIDVRCDIETYDGMQRERWGIWRAQQKLDLDAVQALDAQFAHLLARTNGQSDAASTPPTNGQPNAAPMPPASSSSEDQA
jgi:hypothetical protein